MASKDRRAVFWAVELDTRLLQATKAMPMELLPIVFKPLIQYPAEKVIADQFDSKPEIVFALRAK